MPKGEPKVQFGVRLPRELAEWVDMMVQKKIFGTRTHAVEYALAYLKKVYEREGRLPPIE